MSQAAINEIFPPATKPLWFGWDQMRAFLLILAAGAVLFAGLCWLTGEIKPFGHIQTGMLLALLVMLNLAPPLAEWACKRLDPFDAKHLFLAYFFLILTFHSFCSIELGMVAKPGLAVPRADTSLHIRALAAIVLGLASFVTGCYLPLGGFIARTLPCIRVRISTIRIKIVAIGGLALGCLAFYLLMASAGGIASFLANLGAWRTVGVLAGVGYLTFPITGMMPAAMLLLLLYVLPVQGQRLTWRALGVLVLAIASLGPIFFLGFRINLVPAILFFFAAWHYARQHIPIGRLIALAAGLFVFLTLFGLVRSGQPWAVSGAKEELLFRVPGLDIVERIIWRMDRGEPYHGVAPMLIESATIVIPRAIWPAKPVPSGLAFADIFFSDFFIDRGDPVNGIKSGLSPTCIGEMLWVGGIFAVVLGALALGVSARAAAVWRQRGRGHRLHVFVYVIFMANFAIFAEAPQIALNCYAMFGVMTFGIILLLTARFRWKKTAIPS